MVIAKEEEKNQKKEGEKKLKETEDVKVQGHEVQVVNPVKEGKSVQGKSIQEQKKLDERADSVV